LVRYQPQFLFEYPADDVGHVEYYSAL
jgi:hypothetical protein